MPEASYRQLLEGNKSFVETTLKRDPEFFQRLAKAQTPKVLWIGCADSRVPANQITNTLPGEIFVHRNIANVVVHTDLNCLSVMEYAVNVLEVEHVIVCGHYNCGGVNAAMSANQHGMIDNWLRHIKDIYEIHREELEAIEDPDQRARRMVEFNVLHQALNVGQTPRIGGAGGTRGAPQVEGWVGGKTNLYLVAK